MNRPVRSCWSAGYLSVSISMMLFLRVARRFLRELAGVVPAGGLGAPQGRCRDGIGGSQMRLCILATSDLRWAGLRPSYFRRRPDLTVCVTVVLG